MHKEVYRCIKCNCVILTVTNPKLNEKRHVPIHCVKCENKYAMECTERMKKTAMTRGIDNLIGKRSLANSSLIDE